jgi:cellobiose phosphorylase
MRYGFFDDDRREYVITQPDTPLPWINYLGSQDYIGLISNIGGGYSFYKDARLRRLTRYRHNNVPADSGGRYLYVRDNLNETFWSPTWQPVRQPLDSYTCRHGLGYSIVSAQLDGISLEIKYFVPRDAALEIWDVTITNNQETEADLSIFSLVEFALWDAYDDFTNYQRNLNIGEVEVLGSTIIHKTEYRERRDHFAFFTCSENISGFDTQREAFLGPYCGWDRPQVVEKGESGNSIAHGWSPIGSHHVQFMLPAKGSTRMNFLLGYQENPKNEKFDQDGKVNKKGMLRTLEAFSSEQLIDQAFSGLQSAWTAHLDRLQVKTPDEHVNRMVNIWNPYQNMVTFSLSRSASYFETGVGRGMGFRDSNQDLLGFVHMVPERTRERLLDLAATQLPSGEAYHQYQPLTKRGNNEIGGGFNDDPLWLVLSAAAYLKETGDRTLLEEMVEFDNQPGTEASFFDHLSRSLQFTKDRLGPHGLPLIGHADWNDCLNLNTFSAEPGESFQTAVSKDGQVAESLFIAGLFTLAAREMSALCGWIGEVALAAEYQTDAEKMIAAIREHGWDGEYFLRAYDHFGDKVGSQQCDEGKIFIEPQGMCIMAGFTDELGQKALSAVSEQLSTEHGIMLLQPAFTNYQLRLGEITSYPPGYKENGSIFCHTNPWIMIAEAVMGNGQKALDYYLKINPSAREALSDVHRCEPYVYAQTIAGKDAPTFGEAKNSWLTGTASWNYVAITQWILGVRAEYDGLRIAPVIPAEWREFSLIRYYRGVRCLIKVKREGNGNQVSLQLDGDPLEGDIVPFAMIEGKEEVSVQARID